MGLISGAAARTLAETSSNGSTWSALADQARATALALFGDAIARLPAAILAAFVLFAASLLSRVADRSARTLGTRLVRSTSLHILFSKCAAIGVWIVGIVVASLLLFPGLRLGDVVATLGLGSVAIGFAFADIFKNFLAGILLLIAEPFRIGDAIAVGAYEGVVEHIDVRTTNLRTYTGEFVLIPNSIVFTSSVQVRTKFAQRRSDLTIAVAYGTRLPDALDLARRTLASVEGVLAAPPVVVDATEFGDDGIGLTMRFWTASEHAETLRTRSRAIVAIEAAFETARIEIPFPTRTVVLRGASPPTA